MKKYLLTFIAALASVYSFAQSKGDIAAGVNFSYATQNSNFGIGVKGQYNITDAIRTEASFDYFLKKDGLKTWDINVNAHYLFPVANKIKVYPLVGLTYIHWGLDLGSFSYDDSGSYNYDFSASRLNYYGSDSGIYNSDDDDSDDDSDASSSSGKFGVNLGAGISYEITKNLLLNAEVKYQLISHYNQAVISVGVAYKF